MPIIHSYLTTAEVQSSSHKGLSPWSLNMSPFGLPLEIIAQAETRTNFKTNGSPCVIILKPKSTQVARWLDEASRLHKKQGVRAELPIPAFLLYSVANVLKVQKHNKMQFCLLALLTC